MTTKIWRLAVLIASTFLLFQFISLYLSWPKQLVVGAVGIALAVVLNGVSKAKFVTLALMLLSFAATLRYGWWRVRMIVQFFSDESNPRFTIDSALMLILLSAEAYTMLIMVLGYMQTSFPLQRKPVALPQEEDLWPHVDVIIPTYNEPLSLVRYTAIAANNIDYPPNKLHVYILDDGTRPSFREFAEQAGVGYIVRKEHNHAKAGNINHALEQMTSPLVTIFDCDHIPTRSFLQVTVGWFLAEERLAMLQTPHFFYSPDPFERNLLQFKTIPNEGGLFYGLIQDGSDLWNATFFCGSCAVIRRAALDEVGGIATETVTEDAHTSLRMQKKGWNTAYINMPQAAGLATETLAAHVGQRVRWARGMVQILRTDNPLLSSGLNLTQRLCYFNAMLHFMYAVPRLIFLCAPLLYMLFGRTIIPGYWVAILAYAVPHLMISGLTNSRVQGKFRHSFWNEIYETVLAPYILLPTILALINPKLGKFNVTDKGGTLMETTFDRHIAKPTTWLLFVNLLGLCAAPYRLLVTDPTHPGTVLSNLIWILFNMVVLGVAAAVANEQQQRRTSVRVPAKLHAQFRTQNGETCSATTRDMSVGGAWVEAPELAQVDKGDVLLMSFPTQTGDEQIHATVLSARNGMLRLRFKDLTIAEEETLVCALYSRANSWISSREKAEDDRPLLSFVRVVRLSLTGFHQLLRGLLPRRHPSPTNVAKKAVATAAGLLVLVTPLGLPAHGQLPGMRVLGVPTPGVSGMPDPASIVGQGPASASPQPHQPSLITIYTGESPLVAAAEADTTITFKDMGVQDAIDLHGPHSYSQVGFVLSNSRVPRSASLSLSYRFSPGLLPHTGAIKISLNKTPIARIAAPEDPSLTGEYQFAAIPLPAELLIRHNEITLEFTGGTALETESKARATVLGNVGASSRVLISSVPVLFKRELTLLPLPLFDPDLQTAATIPFVFLSPPSARTLQSAGVIASWFGTLAKAKSPRFSAAIGEIPRGNVVVLANGPARPELALQLPAGGPSLSLRSNPSDPNGTLLVISGENDEELLRAARSLALMTAEPEQVGAPQVLLGDSAIINEFALPDPRKPDDAPRWLTTDHLTSFWSLSRAEALQSDGSRIPPVFLRVPPDLYYGENQNLDVKVTYRYNSLPLAPGSALRIFMNGTLLNEAALSPGQHLVERHRSVMLPVAAMRPFGNTLNFNFDFIPAHPEDTSENAAQKLMGAVLEHSYIDLRGLEHWAMLPNLELFANAGFPFTRRADLAETVVILPTIPTEKEIALLLVLMSHCGTQTGYPALRVEMAGPEAVMRPDRDYLILGGVSDQPSFALLDAALPLSLDIAGVHTKATGGFFAQPLARWHRFVGDLSHKQEPSNRGGPPDIMLEGIESPFFPGRSIALLAIRNEDAVNDFTDRFLERSQSSDISQTVSLFRNGEFSSFTRDTPFYHVGNISLYQVTRLWMAEHFWLLLGAITILSLVLARYAEEHLKSRAEKRLSMSTVAS